MFCHKLFPPTTNLCRITKIEKLELIRLVTDLLLTLYREGWEPMTPIDTAVDKADRSESLLDIKGVHC